MQPFDEPLLSENKIRTTKSILVFMSSHNFREGLFDTVDIGFVINLYKHQLTNHSNVLMTVIFPRGVTTAQYDLLLTREKNLKQTLIPYGVNIDFLHVQGRTLSGAFNAVSELRKRIAPFDYKFIWAKNYFNSFIGVLVKRKLPDVILHSEMSGLVPEEEFYYSYSDIFSRVVKFLVLKLLEKVNLSHADSISVVSKRFKEYIIANHKIDPGKIEILPCYYDPSHFYADTGLREKFRSKYHIYPSQKVLVYSGMLQKWQEPDLLFSFIKNIQDQDVNRKYRFMMLTFDTQKAFHYSEKYTLKNVIIEAASDEELNGLYNAADVGLAFRSADMVSFVSSPVKIPEYLATGNNLIMLKYIGDFGADLKHNQFVLVKNDKSDLLNTKIEEIDKLQRPDGRVLDEIQKRYSISSNFAAIERILNGHQK